MEQTAVEALFGEILFQEDLDESGELDVKRLVNELAANQAEREVLLGEVPRLLVYRQLVHATLKGAIELAMPRAVTRLAPLFEEYFKRFLAQRGPRTHYLRDVTYEFLDFAEPLWANDARVPEWMGDLCRHEALAIEVAAAADPHRLPTSEELSLEVSLEFHPSCRLACYRFRVHELSGDVEDRAPPRRGDTRLFVYRSPEHEVRYLELSPLAARILERLLLKGQTLGVAVTEACHDLEVPLDQAQLTGAAQLLADLAERRALVGSR